MRRGRGGTCGGCEVALGAPVAECARNPGGFSQVRTPQSTGIDNSSGEHAIVFKENIVEVRALTATSLAAVMMRRISTAGGPNAAKGL